MSLRGGMKVAKLSFFIVLITIPLQDVYAFKLSPSGTEIDRQRSYLNSSFFERLQQRFALSGIYQFTEPVHEEITQRIFGCDAGKEICSNPDMDFAPLSVHAGVRWNDDPPFRLTNTSITECKTSQTIRVITQPVCWAKLFKDAEKNSVTEIYDATHVSSNLMYRSHFGDLQFLHAMASKDGESAGETQKRILMWIEFTWRVSLGEYPNGTLLKDIKIEGFNQFFGNVGWNIQDLFTLGDPLLRKDIGKVAFGSLLHVVQDSFAKGHASRRDAVHEEMCFNSRFLKPGVIEEFHSYQHQDHELHAGYDSRLAFEDQLLEKPSVVAVGRTIVDYYDAKASWDSVRDYFSCIFAVEDIDSNSSAGVGLEI